MVYKYREVRGTFTALTPDTTDPDEHPNLVPLNGSVVLTPVFKNGGISFAEEGHFDQPQVKRAAIENGELKAVVVNENTGHLTRQALFLPVTDDERADQQWSYEASFPEVVRTDTGERVVIPSQRFVVEDGAEPLNLAAVATAQKAGAIVTRGPRGYGVDEVTAANAELRFQWEDGHTTSIPMPEAVPGVGVAEATQPYEGGVAFDLTDGTTTSSVSLPAGPPGRDGANVLPGRTTVLSEAWQPDFVDIARQRSPYKTMTLTADSGGGLLVQCRAGIAEGYADDRITYEVTGGDKYRIVGTITEASAQRGESYAPDPEDHSTVAEGDVRLSDGTTSTTGSWLTSSTWYTTEVGATWETTITTHNPGDEVFLSLFLDGRGGVWRMSLVEDESVTSDVSTFSTVYYGTTAGQRVFAVPTPGTYTLRGTFMGADPENPPSGGTARGWLTSESSSGSYYLVRVSKTQVGEAALSPTRSNKNFAFRIAHPEGGETYFVPNHGQDVETLMGPAEFYDGPRRIDVGSMTPGETIEVGELTMVQHLLGHNPYSVSDELVDVRTVDTIMADGTYRAEGRVKALRDLIIGTTSYAGMLPFNPQELDLVVTSLRTSYPSPPLDLPNDRLGEDGLHSTSVAVVGNDPNLIAAVRFNQPEETRRLSRNESTDPMFIQHRDETMGKVYPRLGYASNTLVPAGTVWRFSADYWLGRVPGIRHLIE